MGMLTIINRFTTSGELISLLSFFITPISPVTIAIGTPVSTTMLSSLGLELQLRRTARRYRTGLCATLGASGGASRAGSASCRV
jgi:hypothetical protein